MDSKTKKTKDWLISPLDKETAKQQTKNEQQKQIDAQKTEDPISLWIISFIYVTCSHLTGYFTLPTSELTSIWPLSYIHTASSFLVKYFYLPIDQTTLTMATIMAIVVGICSMLIFLDENKLLAVALNLVYASVFTSLITLELWFTTQSIHTMFWIWLLYPIVVICFIGLYLRQSCSNYGIISYAIPFAGPWWVFGAILGLITANC